MDTLSLSELLQIGSVMCVISIVLRLSTFQFWSLVLQFYHQQKFLIIDLALHFGTLPPFSKLLTVQKFRIKINFA